MLTFESTDLSEELSLGNTTYSYPGGFHSSSSSSASFPSSSPATSPEVLSDDDLVLYPSLSGSGYLDDGCNFVMVVGGLGYIGSHTTLELLKSGYNVIVVDDLSNSYPSILTRITKLAKASCTAQNKTMPAIKFHRLDYRSRAMRWILDLYSSITCSDNELGPIRKSRIIGVIHFAAYKSVEESLRQPLEYYRNNVCGLVDFLALLRQFGILRFVFSSSATVYGLKTKAGKPLKEEDLIHHFEAGPPGDDKDVGEKLALVPGVTGHTSPYGRTKYFCEAILADVAAADPSWNIMALRYFNPVGADPSGLLGEDPRQTPTNLFPVIARVLSREQAVLEVFGTDWETHDGSAVRDFIHVIDLARGHIAALDAALAGKVDGAFRAYNLGTGEGATVLEVVKAVEEASSRAIPLRYCGRRAGDVGYCVAATARAEQELGWIADRRLVHCARDMWNFISVNGNVRLGGQECPF